MLTNLHRSCLNGNVLLPLTGFNIFLNLEELEETYRYRYRAGFLSLTYTSEFRHVRKVPVPVVL
jgi:hypothetical protein